MVRSDSHVGLIAAAMAAITLHAIVLLLMTTTHPVTEAPTTMHIALLPTAASSMQHPQLNKKQQPSPPLPHRSAASFKPLSTPQTTAAHKKDLSHASAHKAVQKATQTVEQNNNTARRQQLQSSQKPVVANHKASTPGKQQHSMTLPEAAKIQIMAQIDYPRQARRHGWQGTVKMQFTVEQQSIQKLTLLASSGHAILDRAAYRGLTRIDRILLPNGLYYMPILFRLQ